MMKYILCVAALAVSLEYVWALTEEDKKGIRDILAPHVVECGKQFGIEDETLKDSKEKGTTEGLDNCFLACVFKRIDIIDGEGKFVPEKAMEKAKKYEKTDEDLKAHSAVIEECSAVNTAKVSDGDTGCERAKLLTDCLIKNKQNILGN